MHKHLIAIDTFFIVLSLVHIIFPKYFNWKKELASLSLITKQIFKVHTFFIALMVFLMGLLCISSTEELITTKLGSKVVLGLAIFWSLRLFFQLFIYSPNLWKGKVFETVIHIFFTLTWIYISIIFWSIYIF